MSFLERRIAVERVVSQAQQGDPEALRRLVWAVVEDEYQSGRKEMTLIAAALTLVAGGKVLIPGPTFGAVPEGGALEMRLKPDGALEISCAVDMSPMLRALALASGGTVLTQEAPPDSYAPANPSEPDEQARPRVADAIRLFVDRHYRPELEARGHGFMVTVLGELLAMAIGIRRASIDTNPALVDELQELLQELEPRIERYERVTAAARQTAEGEPGAPSTNPTRVM